VTEITAAQIMGHRSSAMVRRVYAHIGATAKAAAIAKLPQVGVALPGAASHDAPVTDLAAARAKRAAGTLSVSNGATSRGGSGPPGRTADGGAPPKTGAPGVPRDGIEPPTRGFSIRVGSGKDRRVLAWKAVFEEWMRDAERDGRCDSGRTERIGGNPFDDPE